MSETQRSLDCSALYRFLLVLITHLPAHYRAFRGCPSNWGKTSVRPVSMAAITTILGMVPLLADAFFESMAAAIMFGLGFATILTLIIVPVLYTLFHGIRYRSLKALG